MPYLIINDKTTPTLYNRGASFDRAGVTDNENLAQQFHSLTAATDHLRRRPNVAQLYSEGWRIVPVRRHS